AAFNPLCCYQAAGGISAGAGVWETLIKECAEEACIPESLASKAKPAGTVSYAYQKGEAVFLECQFVFDLEVPESFQPRVGDGEVHEFYLWPLDNVREAIAEEQFKPNCALVVLDFLLRHGYIQPDKGGHTMESCAPEDCGDSHGAVMVTGALEIWLLEAEETNKRLKRENRALQETAERADVEAQGLLGENASLRDQNKSLQKEGRQCQELLQELENASLRLAQSEEAARAAELHSKELERRCAQIQERGDTLSQQICDFLEENKLLQKNATGLRGVVTALQRDLQKKTLELEEKEEISRKVGDFNPSPAVRVTRGTWQTPEARSHAWQTPEARSHACGRPPRRAHTRGRPPRRAQTRVADPRGALTRVADPRGTLTRVADPRGTLTCVADPRGALTRVWQTPEARSHAPPRRAHTRVADPRGALTHACCSVL
ncbi:uncharacterized protein LOC142483148, partial [Ascaphus truei]|uniref:uncharacterized protein LOC142483148 n=1 Tax=Ascaphus truei TaxID=8439 RepID=UPI003F5AA774